MTEKFLEGYENRRTSNTTTFEEFILNKNGLIIFTDEINVKYHNPFHINFWDEEIFTNILKKRFEKMNILRNCGFPTYSTHPFTKHKDNPDFFVFKD